MSGAMNRHCISRINYHHSPDEDFSAGVSGGIKNDTGVWRVHVTLCQRPGADTEETGRYDSAWKDLCSVLNALGKW